MVKVDFDPLSVPKAPKKEQNPNQNENKEQTISDNLQVQDSINIDTNSTKIMNVNTNLEFLHKFYGDKEFIRENAELLPCENIVIYEKASFRNDEPIYPDDIYMRSSKIFEGIKQTVNINKYERDSSARHICIEHKGSTCAICGFNFGKVYGQSFQGKIHVHHIVPISQIGEKYELDPINDLIPVCPNCHLILHSKGKNDAYTPEQVKQFLEINSRAMSQTT